MTVDIIIFARNRFDFHMQCKFLVEASRYRLNSIQYICAYGSNTIEKIKRRYVLMFLFQCSDYFSISWTMTLSTQYNILNYCIDQTIYVWRHEWTGENHSTSQQSDRHSPFDIQKLIISIWILKRISTIVGILTKPKLEFIATKHVI